MVSKIFPLEQSISETDVEFSYDNKWQVNENCTKLISDRHEICDNVLKMMEMYSDNCETKGKTLNCPSTVMSKVTWHVNHWIKLGCRSSRFTVNKPRERYFSVSFFLFLPLCHDISAFLSNSFWLRLDIYKWPHIFQYSRETKWQLVTAHALYIEDATGIGRKSLLLISAYPNSLVYRFLIPVSWHQRRTMRESLVYVQYIK